MEHCKNWAEYNGGTAEYQWCKRKSCEVTCVGIKSRCHFPKLFRKEDINEAKD